MHVAGKRIKPENSAQVPTNVTAHPQNLKDISLISLTYWRWRINIQD